MRRLRGVIAARDEEISVLEAQVRAAVSQVRATVSRLDEAVEHICRQDLRIAELERRLNMDSSDSVTPSSKEGIGAKAERRAREKKDRQGGPAFGGGPARGAFSPLAVAGQREDGGGQGAELGVRADRAAATVQAAGIGRDVGADQGEHGGSARRPRRPRASRGRERPAGTPRAGWRRRCGR